MTFKTINEMSDDEISALSPDEYVKQLDEQDKTVEEDTNKDAVKDTDKDASEDTVKDKETKDELEDTAKADADDEADAENAGSDDEDDGEAKPEEVEETTEKTDADEKKDESWDSLKDIVLEGDVTVNDLETAKRLINLGSKYDKNAASNNGDILLANSLKQAGVSDPKQVNLLLDVVKGDKTAIAKFLSSIKVDPLDIDVDTASEYKEKDSLDVDTKQIAFDRAVSNIKESNNTEKFLGFYEQLSDTEQKDLSNTPEGIDMLNEHINIGLYDEIMERISKEKVRGNLRDVPISTAYEEVGKQMLQELQTKSIKVKPKAKSTKQVKQPAQKAPADVEGDSEPFGFSLNLSDEEFMENMNKVLTAR